MTVKELQEARDTIPFLPFIVRMADGRSFHVPHRDFISVPPVGRIATIYKQDGACSILDVMLMTEITIDAPPTQSDPTKLPPHQHN